MKVELLDFYGSDLMICNAARTSYNKQKNTFDEKDIKLINYLANPPEGIPHWAPFGHPQLTFRVSCSVVVERQLFKHKISVIDSSLSGRYVDFSDKYDLPAQLRYQSKDSKQGSAGDLEASDNYYFYHKMQEVVDLAQKVYKEMVDFGISKEQCRYVCPLALETTFVRTMSFYAFINMCKQRLKKNTQQETREVVQEMLNLVRNIPENPFKYSLQVFKF